MNRDESKQPVVLVTGASTGLGLAIARRILAVGYRLILTARQESLLRFAKLGLTESEEVWIRPMDVTNDQQRREVVAEASQRWGGVDILINNAGIAYRTVVEHIDEKSWQDIMEVDVHAPLELSQLVLPGMRARQSGHILNISSVGGMMAMPTMALYSAAKFALEGATEALWYEVRPWNIHVTLVEPGFVRSDSFRNTRFTQRSFRAVVDEHDPYHEHYHHMAGFIERLMERTIATPERIADRILAAIQAVHPPLRVYATPDAHLFAMLRRLLPRGLYHRILYFALPRVGRWGRNGGGKLTAD